nr:hypothetical protein [Actinomycetales bacterium]
MLQYLADLLVVIGRALRLDPNALAGMEAHGPWSIQIGIAALATVSTVAGEAIVLAINQVRRLRLAHTLTISLLGRLLSYLTLGGLVWLAGVIVLPQTPALEDVVRAVMVSAAPYVFGFLVLLPYTGPAVERLIQGWGLLVLWAIVVHEFGTERWRALLITSLGVLAALLVSRILGRPLAWIRDRLWRLVTGEPLMLSTQEILDQFPLPAGNGQGQTGGAARGAAGG